jgi:hypothetical protein
LDYVVARWGHATALFAWELWNEADLAEAYSDTTLLEWHKEMAAYLKKIDAHGHLVTTSVSDSKRHFGLFELKNIDFVSVHMYTHDVVDRIHQDYELYERLGKPVFVGEFAGGVSPADDGDDRVGARLHAGLWAALMTPLAGNAMPWWWDTHIEKNDLYYHWRALTRFAGGIDRRGKTFRIIRSKARVSTGRYASLRALTAPGEIHLWVYDAQRFRNAERPEHPLLHEEKAVRLDGVLGGNYDIEIWDTYKGEVTHRRELCASNGVLRFSLPPCEQDIAVRLMRQGGGQLTLDW